MDIFFRNSLVLPPFKCDINIHNIVCVCKERGWSVCVSKWIEVFMVLECVVVLYQRKTHTHIIQVEYFTSLKEPLLDYFCKNIDIRNYRRIKFLFLLLSLFVCLFEYLRVSVGWNCIDDGWTQAKTHNTLNSINNRKKEHTIGVMEWIKHLLYSVIVRHTHIMPAILARSGSTTYSLIHIIWSDAIVSFSKPLSVHSSCSVFFPLLVLCWCSCMSHAHVPFRQSFQ